MRRLLGPPPSTPAEAVNRSYLESVTAAQYTIPGSNNAPVYRRLAVIDGGSVDAGAHAAFFLSGLGNYGVKDRATALIQIGVREANNAAGGTRIWVWGGESNQIGSFYVLTISSFKFELWHLPPQYTMESRLTLLSRSSGATIDTVTTSSSSAGLFGVSWQQADQDSVARVLAQSAATQSPDLSHVQDTKYAAYGHSFGQVQSPIQNTTAAGVYPNRVLDYTKADIPSFQNLTISGARTAAILTQIQNTWTQGTYGFVTIMCNQNDVGDRTAEATFKANVKGMIDWLRGTPFPPTIVMVLDTTCTAAGYARYANPPTDAVVAQYNQFIRDVVATYNVTDGSIVIADASNGWNPATMTGSDGQHPNDRGSAFIAAAIRAALSTVSFREGQNVGLVPPSTIFYDSFNRANSTTLGTAMYGTAWTMLGSSVYGTIGNRAYRSDSGAVQESAAVVDLGKSNIDLSLKMDAITLKGSGPVWRAVDINSMWAVDILGTGVGNAKVYKKVSGTFTQVGSALTVEVKTGSTVRVVTSGSTHTVYVDGVQAWTATDAQNSTATKHGFRITDTSANANRINDFVLR